MNLKDKGGYMRKKHKEKEGKQLELDLQTMKLQDIQAVETKRPNLDLSKKLLSSNVEEVPACGEEQEKPQALFFGNLISVEELAVVLGLAPQTIRNWVALGKIPYVKIGRRNMFLKRSMQEWLNRKEKPQWR